MASRPMVVAAAVASALAFGCSGTASRRASGPGGPKTPELPKVKPEALREFDAGLRALRLGGPESREKAMVRLRAAIEIDGTLWEAWYNLGIVLLEEGESSEAAEAFSEALKVNPAHTPALSARAEAYRLDEETKRARKDYQEVLDRDPQDLATAARLASLLRQSGSFEDALDVLREALRVAGATSEIYVELGLIYLAQGRDELAELVFAKARELDPKNPAAYNGEALLALARGKSQDAFDRFDQATVLDPAFHDARFNKASVLIDVGDYARAVEELEVVVSENPEDYAAQVALGVAARGAGDLDRARKTWDRVVKSAPRKSRAREDALFNLAILEQDFVMDDKKAAAALDRFLQVASSKHPKHKEAVERRKELGQ